jgi:Family of unknown function (DUF6502)
MTERRVPRSLRLPQNTVRGAAALQQLLTELALVLLPRGMTPKRFGELARSAFVQAAADMSRLRNGRINHSRVAAQTGLTRADVKRLLKDNVIKSTGHGQTAVERVIQGWRTDSEFLTRPGHPKRLRISSTKRSFAQLVRKYGGDVPHRAVLDELRRIGAVNEIEGTVQLQGSRLLRQRHNFSFLSPVLPALIDGLRIASARGQRSGTLSSIQRLSLSPETEVDLSIVRDRCTSSAQSMLDGLAHSLSTEVTVPRRARKPAYSFTVTVLLSEYRARTTKRDR